MIDARNPVTRAVRPVVAEVRPPARAVAPRDQSVGDRAAVVDLDQRRVADLACGRTDDDRIPASARNVAARPFTVTRATVRSSRSSTSVSRAERCARPSAWHRRGSSRRSRERRSRCRSCERRKPGRYGRASGAGDGRAVIAPQTANAIAPRDSRLDIVIRAVAHSQARLARRRGERLRELHRGLIPILGFAAHRLFENDVHLSRKLEVGARLVQRRRIAA